MEFFKKVNKPTLTPETIKSLLTIKRLPDLCQSIISVISDNKDHGVIYCVWGQFDVNREIIKDGLRFSLPSCPNALCWTITNDTDCNYVTIHCTINTASHDDDFIDSIRQFVDDWSSGLLSLSPE